MNGYLVTLVHDGRTYEIAVMAEREDEAIEHAKGEVDWSAKVTKVKLSFFEGVLLVKITEE
jgi:hypothetical protein